MRGWLLDTNVISTFAPGKPVVAQAIAAWFRAVDDELFLSTVTVAEIGAGIAKLQRAGADRRARALAEWFDTIAATYGDRLLAFDLPAAQKTGQIIDAARGHGHVPGFADAAIAGIATVNDLTVLTANLRHFEPLGVRAIDPFQAGAIRSGAIR